MKSPYVAEALFNDPRLRQGKQLILDALADHKRSLTGIRPSEAECKITYQQMLAQFAELRGGELYFPYLGSGAGCGALVELADGSVKYDMISGIGAHVMGHANAQIIAACIDAAVRDTVMQGNLQQNIESATLAQQLVDAAKSAGSSLKHCFLTTSGAMANENALKLALQQRHPAIRLLAFERCFMGRTLAMASVTDRAKYRDGLPLTLPVDYLPFFDETDPQGSTTRAVEVLHATLGRYPGRHAAMCLELVQGEGGYYPGSIAFFNAIVDVLEEANIAVFVDEVQTFGRLSTMFAFECFGLADRVDIVTIGKMSQVCATLYCETFKPRPGLISQTFTASTSAIFSAMAILQCLRTGGLFGVDGRIANVHQQFVDRFQAIHQRHPDWIAGPYGVGGMIAFQAFDGEAARTRQLLDALFEAGVIAFVTGSAPARVRFLPPLAVISDADIAAVCKVLESTMAELAD